MAAQVPAPGGASPGDLPDDDGRLCASARGGDRAAYEVLVRRYQRPVYGLAVRLLRNQEDARDAAQEVFVKAWLSLDGYDPARSFAPWLMTIARNHYRDRLRRSAVRKGDVQRDDPTETLARLPDHAADAEDVAAQGQAGEALESALANLPDHYREVVVLHHIQDRPVKEIADIVGRPQGTVMTWLYRARAQLKQSLSQHGVEA